MSIIPSNSGGPVSSMVTSLEPGLLRQVEQALRIGQPRTVTECYHHFELEKHGISRSAFFRYAARIRQLCDLDEAAERIQPGDLDVSGYLPTLLGRKLLGILLHEPDVDITKLHRLTLAYRAASNTYLAFDDRKKKTPPADPETELLRLKTIAMIHDHQDNLQRQMTEREKAAGASRRVAAGARFLSRTHKEWESVPTKGDNPDDNSTGNDSRHTPCEKGLSPRRLFDTHKQAPNTKTPDPGLPINRSREVECRTKLANPRAQPDNALSEISNLKSEITPAPALRAEEEKKPPIPMAKTTGNHRPPSGQLPRTDPTARASIHDILNNRTRRHEKKPNNRAQHRHGIRVEELSDGPCRPSNEPN